MTAAVGNPTLRLIRVKIGINPQLELTLKGLSPGQWRYLNTQEQKNIEKIVS
jgi:23S rRNA pseudouridine2457 synthase